MTSSYIAHQEIADQAEFLDRPSFLSRFAKMNTLWITIALLIEIALFAFWLPAGTFVSVYNFQTIASDSANVLILATAATLVIVTGGIDVSVGSTLTLSAVCAARVVHALTPSSQELAVVAGIATGISVGIIVGAFNGYLIAYRKLPAFVVTLGSLGIALGIARLASGGVGISGLPEGIRGIVDSQWLGMPMPFLIALAVVVFFTFLLEQTRFGEHTYFIGSSAEASTRGGVNVPLHTMSIYVIAGVLAGAAGVVDFARFEVASVTTGHTTELIASIAAVVIGGGSLFGGVGSLKGTFVGVFIPVILTNGLLIAGIERFWQDVITGFILILAVGFDQWRRQAETTA
jgi:ribose transport system permease protein